MQIALTTLLVADYDTAIAWFRGALGFVLRSDEPREGGKRWVVVGPADGGGSLLLARAVGEEQQARVGDQTGGRVAFFVQTRDFHGDYARMRAFGVQFVEHPRHEDYGWVVVFRDLCGNRWDLLEQAA